MAIGRFTMRHFDGVEVFGLEYATMWVLPDRHGVRLLFEAETDGKPLQIRPDAAKLRVHPNALVSVALKEIDPERLVGSRFSVPNGYDDEIDDQVSTVYYLEHDPLDKNEIEVIAQDGNKFHVHWTGTSSAVEDYEGRLPKATVEIEGWFTFREMQKWLRT